MSTNTLEKLKERYISLVENKLKNMHEKRSNNENKLKKLVENLEIGEDLLKKVASEIEGIGRKFIDELNSEKFSKFSIKEKEDINKSFRAKVKDLTQKYYKKFLLLK